MDQHVALDVQDLALADTRHSGWLSRHGEACLFWTLVVAHLVPIWAYRYFPTQDGPVHVSSANILKEYGSPGTRSHEFYEVRLEPFPNWTSHLFLAGLLFVVPPLVAEKILVSVYVLAFAASLRYLCGSFGDRARPLALVGLLFVFNRCLWLGFYNSVLTLPLFCFVLGYWLRRRAQADLATVAGLTLLLAAAFFTHLVGFLVTVAGLYWLALTSPRHRWRNLGLVVLASLPALFFTLDYFDRTRFFGSGAAHRLRDHPWQWLRGHGSWARLTQDLTALDREFFAHHTQALVPMTLVALLLFVVLAVVTLLAFLLQKNDPAPLPSRWPMAILALGFAVIYVVLPDDLMDHGSFLKSRLALLPPLLVLTCFREPDVPAARLVLRALVVLVLAVNLVLVTRRVGADNVELAEYTAGVEAAGTGHTLFVIQEFYRQSTRRGREIVDPLLHASQYYCLDTGNLNLDNYEATTKYFPLRYRAGVPRGRGSIAIYRRQDAVDVILAWETGPDPIIPEAYRLVFRQGRLLIFAKQP